jgi:hypothetical protein
VLVDLEPVRLAAVEDQPVARLDAEALPGDVPGDFAFGDAFDRERPGRDVGAVPEG